MVSEYGTPCISFINFYMVHKNDGGYRKIRCYIGKTCMVSTGICWNCLSFGRCFDAQVRCSITIS